MKISETKVETKQFQPVTLNITFETREELEYFYGMANAPNRGIIDNAEHKCNCEKWNAIQLDKFSMALFRWVNNKLFGRNSWD